MIENKKSQITIFVIIGILIVVGVVLFFFIRNGQIGGGNVPSSIVPVYDNFLNCIDESVELGADTLGTQGGHIYVNELEFEPGSAYMPFSSQLDFYGNAVPYWYYVSENNIQREQVPSKSSMESELERLIEERVEKCNLDLYRRDGFVIVFDNNSAKANVKINENNIEVVLDMDLNIEKGDDKFSISSHKRNVKSNLGELYDTALKIYEHEQETLFLEEYGVDVLRLYAPVDGIEFSCAPKTWIALNISDNLRNGIDANIQAIKVKGNYYDLTNDNDKYFVVDVGENGGFSLPSETSVNFLTSKYWPYGFEVSPTKDDLLIANPIGNQAGLGILGFCYVPYHFVYDVKYPVLVQVVKGDGSEIFQFPVAVVIQGNLPREAAGGETVNANEVELCKYSNQEIDVKVYNTDLNLVDADVSFSCLGAKCNIGQTVNGELKELFPQCVNGVIQVKAEGYEYSNYLISTNSERNANIILKKLYKINAEAMIDNRIISDTSSVQTIISFTSLNENGENGIVKTIIYPEQKTISLSEGLYEISVQAYDDSSLKIGATTKEQCYEVPRGVVGGFFGITKKECVDVEFPEQVVSQVLVGGGSIEYYVLESELKSSNTIEVNVQSLIKPESIDALQANYAIAEGRSLSVRFK